MTRTAARRFTSASVRCEPMKEAPPVTRTGRPPQNTYLYPRVRSSFAKASRMTTTEARPLTSRFFGTRVAGPVSLLSSIPLDGLSETQGERGARAPTKLFRCLRCVWTSLADVLRASRHELDLGGA